MMERRTPGEASSRLAARPWLRVSPYWLLLFLLVWWILAEPRAGAWVAGAAAVVVGALLHALLGGRAFPTLHARGLVAFVPFFIAQSIRGGVDVGRRALDPAMPLAPDLVPYGLTLAPGPARTFFTSVISLLPGTLSARMGEDEILIHLLARDPGTEDRLRELERRVGALFGEESEERGGAGAGPPGEAP